MKEVDQIKKYLNIAIDRKYWILIPFLLTILAGLAYAMTAQRMFRGETLIFIIPQKVPEGYVRSIVNLTLQERVRTINQQVRSRTNLENIMVEHMLFNEPGRAALLKEVKLDLFRKRIRIDVARETAIKIAFDYEDPKKAMDVTNKLASNFISENLRIREEQALGTMQFLQGELENTRFSLEEKEEIIKNYRQQHLGSMPEDLASNLTILQRLQTRLDQLNTNLIAAEERRLVIQQQMAAQKMMQEQMAADLLRDSSSGGETRAPLAHEPQEITSLRNELSKIELKYTNNHPEVRRLKSMIAIFERQQTNTPTEKEEAEVEEKVIPGEENFSLTNLLKPQLEQVNVDIASLRAEIQKIKTQVEMYEQKVEKTPERNQEMISLTRDYGSLQTQYENLLRRKLEADIAVNMEHRQKSEQFHLLDPAMFPEKPIKPDVLKILLMSCALGLCLSGGLAFTVEVLDTSYKNPEEAEEELGLPVIGSLGYRYTNKELRMQKAKSILKGAFVVGGFAISALCIMVATKGADKTFNFIKSFFIGQM